MTPINFHKKEKPLTSLVGMGGGASGMANAGLAAKTYIEDLFSNYVYMGTGASGRAVNNNIDLSGKGGLTWIKRRDGTNNHILVDSAQGATKYTSTNAITAPTTDSATVSSFSSTGFVVGSSNNANGMNDKYGSSTFRKEKGFFTVVEWTGNGVAGNTVSHDLGCVPGCMIVRRISDSAGNAASSDWTVYHRGIGGTKSQRLNAESATMTGAGPWNDTDVTDSVITLGSSADTNGNNDGYIAYIFAGGESPAANARSVDFDGSDDKLTPSQVMLPSGKDSNKFCLETWVNFDVMTGNNMIYSQYTGSAAGRMFFTTASDNITLWMGGTGLNLNTGSYSVFAGQWYHVAWTYDGTNHRLFLDGTLKDTLAGSSLPADIHQGDPVIGNSSAGGWILNGQLSNFRITLDQAVYTTSFKPSTEPLTTTSQGVTGTNCKILCCNNSTVTHNDGSGVTLTSAGGPTASTDSPFDDPEGFKFGEEGDQNLIKCGSYRGNGTGGDNGVEVDLGWQPQYLLMKNSSLTSSDSSWLLVDNMRGIVSNNDDAVLRANLNAAEVGWQRLSLTGRGFVLTDSNPQINGSGNKILYIAIRGWDALVKKPDEAGTDAFAMDVGNGSSDIPPGTFDSGWPVDLGIMREPASNSQWYTTSRLQGYGYVRTNDDTAEAQGWPSFYKGSNVGWGQDTYSTNWMSWMWKRGAGFDTVCYTGDGRTSKTLAHGLGRTPEMIWTKNREDTDNWICYHKGLNEGIDPWTKFIKVNQTGAEVTDASAWHQTAPTSTHFTVGNADNVNYDGHNVVAYLFASVDGISKCGYYTGDNTSDGSKVITTGFQPRFIIIKSTSNAEVWAVLDTLRGIQTGGNDQILYLNSTDAQVAGTGVDLSATGFSLRQASGEFNANNYKYIYYAHA